MARDLAHYSLDAILTIGYRVRSGCGVQFRRWATERLHEYLVKGFTMDDADATTRAEYEAFTDRRRALLEAEGKSERFKLLEKTA